MKRIAIIPARGGSKRIKKKNIKLFYNKPIILYTLDALKNSNIFSIIHISTEDEEIYNLITKNGNQPDFKRPKNLSKDDTPVIKVVEYTIKKYKEIGKIFDQIWLVMPCNPLLDKAQILDAKKVFENKCSDKALLAIKESTHFSKLLTINTGNNIQVFDKKKFSATITTAY